MSSENKPLAVLKFGGDVVADQTRLRAVVGEVAQLTGEGWQFILCHGGNPQANSLTKRLKLERKQVGGRRITDAATLQVMKQVLAGEANVDVVAAAAAAGLNAVGISGVSAGTVTAVRRPPKVFSGCGDEPVDFGFVGEITEIKTGLIEDLLKGGYTPVMNTLGITETGEGDHDICQAFNINADTVSAALAAKLGANHLFLMTGVPGVMRDINDPASRIPRLDEADARQAIRDEVIVGGMIPKIEEALKNLQRGIGAIHILGNTAGALLAEAHEPGSSGTALTLD
jgi:acetylglutamate kinase